MGCQLFQDPLNTMLWIMDEEECECQGLEITNHFQVQIHFFFSFGTHKYINRRKIIECLGLDSWCVGGGSPKEVGVERS